MDLQTHQTVMLMTCRFRGEFKGGERTRIEEAVHRFERANGKGTSDAPEWTFVHFVAPRHGSSYWGVRVEDGFMVKAQTGKGLAMAVDIAREEEIKRRSRALRHASRSASERVASREAWRDGALIEE